MKVGFTCSAFDLLHAGHIDMLRQAREKCDYLIVGLQNDPSLDRVGKNKPVQSIVERYVQLAGCRFVDEIIPYNTERDLEDLLSILSIDIRIVGEEYKDKFLTGRDICVRRGIEIFYNKREHRFSSSELRNRLSTNSDSDIDISNDISLNSYGAQPCNDFDCMLSSLPLDDVITIAEDSNIAYDEYNEPVMKLN